MTESPGIVPSQPPSPQSSCRTSHSLPPRCSYKVVPVPPWADQIQHRRSKQSHLATQKGTTRTNPRQCNHVQSRTLCTAPARPSGAKPSDHCRSSTSHSSIPNDGWHCGGYRCVSGDSSTWSRGSSNQTSSAGSCCANGSHSRSPVISNVNDDSQTRGCASATSG